MSSKITPWIAFFMAGFICLFMTSAYSQIPYSIEEIRQQQQSVFELRMEKARQYAAAHTIPLSQSTEEGNHVLLVDVIDGIPVFVSTLNSGAATTTGVTKIRNGINGLNLQGKNMLIGVWDGGKVIAHSEFEDRMISNETNVNDSHATHVMGTLIAKGIDPNAKGMAPLAKATNWLFDNDLAEMAALAKPDQASLLFSNHSYGTVTGWTKINGIWTWTGNPSVSSDEDYRFGFYGDKAKAIDQLANLSPYYTIVWAAGNDRGEPGDGSRPPDCNNGTGYDCIIPESVAKNIITVGAINKVSTYTGPSSVVMSSFSSWGPTDDGRIKPDLVGAGVDLFSTSAVGANAYEVRSGTSMATPNVLGSLALIQELYKNLHGGLVMKSTTLKALAIHTAKEAGLLPGPDYSFGWGLLDVEAAAQFLLKEDGISNVLEELELSNGNTYQKLINPTANQKITATIVWNDPAANPVAASLDPQNLMLINDLDIKLVAQNGSEYYPWLLDPATPSAQAIKGNNYRDNVEKLEFNLPEAKPYTLVVSHKGQLLNGSQSFSLILSYKSSLASGSTFYWIGDSGNWNDNTHWSLSSGGSPAFAVPTSTDNVIVDENSFDGVGQDQITLLQDRSIRSFKWVRATPAKLSLQSNNLAIGNELAIANNSFGVEGSGVIKCSSLANGKLFFSDTDLGLAGLTIAMGGWELRGNLTADELKLEAGNLVINSSDVTLSKLNSSLSSAIEFTLNNTELHLKDQSGLDGINLTLSGNNSRIITEGASVTLDWSNIQFDGELEVASSNLFITGTNQIGNLKLNPGTSVSLGDGSVLEVDNIIGFEGTVGNPIAISSSTKSTIDIASHVLLCTDFINITNVDLGGEATVNLGVNSIFINSLNWLSQPCASVVFADFDEAYLCQNGFTEFIDRSNGSIISWDWDFGEANSNSTFQNPFHKFENAGSYQIRLSVTDGQSTNVFTKEIEIVPSSVNSVEVAVNANELTSLTIAPEYQWYYDEQKIEGATARSYAYNGAAGVYRVVTYNGVCNLASNLVVITGISENVQIKVFPNPASDVLHISGINSMVKVLLRDAMGKVVFMYSIANDVELPLYNLNNGIYFLELKGTKHLLRQKIIINR